MYVFSVSFLILPLFPLLMRRRLIIEEELFWLP